MERGRLKEIKTKHGFGLIEIGHGEEVFFQRKDCKEVEFESLHEGQQVEFDLDLTARPGVLRAHNVRVAVLK